MRRLCRRIASIHVTIIDRRAVIAMARGSADIVMARGSALVGMTETDDLP